MGGHGHAPPGATRETPRLRMRAFRGCWGNRRLPRGSERVCRARPCWPDPGGRLRSHGPRVTRSANRCGASRRGAVLGHARVARSLRHGRDSRAYGHAASHARVAERGCTRWPTGLQRSTPSMPIPVADVLAGSSGCACCAWRGTLVTALEGHREPCGVHRVDCGRRASLDSAHAYTSWSS